MVQEQRLLLFEITVVAGASWILNHMLSAATSEATAIQRGLGLVENLGCKNVIVESDSL